MNPINFINPTSMTEHRSMARFIQHTLCMCIVAALGMISVTIYQLHLIKTLKQDNAALTKHCNRFEQTRTKHKQLLTTEQEVRATLNTIEALRKKQANPHSLIHALQSSQSETTRLLTLSIHGREITAIIRCTTPRNAHMYAQALIKTGLFATAQITELTSQGKQYQVTLQLTCRTC